MIGIGPTPTADIDKLMNIYYSLTLQRHFEDIEVLLDEGLELPKPFGTEFDTDNLMRMDTGAQVLAVRDIVGAGVMSPNEGRKRFDLSPVKGGEAPFLQEQNWPIGILAARDTPVRPPTAPADTTSPAADAQSANDNAAAQARRLLETVTKGLAA